MTTQRKLAIVWPRAESKWEILQDFRPRGVLLAVGQLDVNRSDRYGSVRQTNTGTTIRRHFQTLVTSLEPSSLLGPFFF